MTELLLKMCEQFPVLMAGVLLWALWVAGCVVERLARMVMVLVRGWPPAHLDADGEFHADLEAGEKGGDK